MNPQEMQGLASQLIDSFLKIEVMTHSLATKIGNLDKDFGSFTLGLNDSLWRAASAQPPHGSQHHHWASEIINCLEHRHDGDGRDTWQMAGALVVPTDMVESAKTLNQEKDVFATLIHRYRQIQTLKPGLDRIFHPEKITQIVNTGQHTRQVLKRIARGRVHLRHVTRHILCLKEYPKFMSLSWVRQRRSIQKMSYEQCLHRLDKLNRDAQSSNISQQIAALNRVPKHQHHLLRLVQTVAYPSIKTKVTWMDGSDDHLGYLSLPALIPQGPTRALPAMTKIAPEPPPARARKRSDNTLPDEPLCPSIRVYLANAQEVV